MTDWIATFVFSWGNVLMHTHQWVTMGKCIKTTRPINLKLCMDILFRTLDAR